jgi:hypothetical protein
MAMPETSMNEDDGLVLGKDDVGLSRKCSRMKRESESQAVQGTSKIYFRPGVSALNSSHSLGALPARKKVDHNSREVTPLASYQETQVGAHRVREQNWHGVSDLRVLGQLPVE